ncbi:Ycf48-like protein [Planctomycetes bacterium Poly30]|uniref:Ycf48-like protein n=1 Tax=Saltatorellus ferox TaxID=2528018 RepID=A0A518EYX3_9BACT|nr:Ycf48-like protein [Planctomycetes bacterium Poly30]
MASDTRIWRTDNGGQSWTSITPSPLGTYHAIDMVGDVGYAVGTKLIKTTDGGLTWTFVEDPALRYYGIDFADAEIGHRVGEQGAIDFTDDGGMSWTSQSSGVTTTLRQIDTLGPTVALAVGDHGVVILTSDGGATWTPVSPPGVTNETLYGATIGGGTAWFSGSEAGVWRLGPPQADCEVQSYCQGKVHSGGSVAALTLFGTPNVANGSYGVGILDALPGSVAIGFESTTGPNTMPLHGGTLCVLPPLNRLSVLSLDGSGFGFYTLPMTPAMVGTTRWYQLLFRDPANPDGTGIGLTDGLRITFCP